MSDQFVLVPVPGLGVLRMTEEALRAALAAGAEWTASATPAPAAPSASGETLLTPEQAAELTGTKPSWWRAAARTGKVPSTKIGRYPRFRAADVRALAQGAA